MRMIDGDVLKEILRGKLIEFVKHPTFVRSDMEEGIDRGIGCALLAIDEMPTVDAIHVDWMLKRMNETALTDTELNNAFFMVGVEWERRKCNDSERMAVHSDV